MKKCNSQATGRYRKFFIQKTDSLGHFHLDLELGQNCCQQKEERGEGGWAGYLVSICNDSITEPYNIETHEMISITLRSCRVSTNHKNVIMTVGICTMFIYTVVLHFLESLLNLVET